MQAHKEKGNALFKDSKFIEAITAYEEAIFAGATEGEKAALAPIYSNCAACHTQLRNFQAAELSAAAAIECDPDFVKGYYRRALARVELQSWDGAISDAEDGLLRGGSNAEFDKLLALALTGKAKREGREYNHRTETQIRNGRRYLRAKEREEGVCRLSSGVLIQVLNKGNGRKSPQYDDACSVDYVGTLMGGEVFDSSKKQGKPAVYAPNEVIKGWAEVLQLMVEGDQWRVFIPFECGYGEAGYGQRGSPKDIPAYAALTFEIDLLKVHAAGKSAEAARAAFREETGKDYDEVPPRSCSRELD